MGVRNNTLVQGQIQGSCCFLKIGLTWLQIQMGMDSRDSMLLVDAMEII